MKRFFIILTFLALLVSSLPVASYAQDGDSSTKTEAVASDTNQKPVGLTKTLQQNFIKGGPQYMAPILICLILGLAISISRIITLNMDTISKSKFLDQINSALKSGNVNEAKEIAKSTRGPIANIFYQGLDRVDDGIDVVEKSISSYGSVISSRLEGGLSWLSLFIAIAPMLGFMGTVIGMILAFDNISKAGDVDISIIAGDINVALLTTVFGLITAIILQVFYNYILSKVDNLVIDMEDSSVSLVDMLIKYNICK